MPRRAATDQFEEDCFAPDALQIDFQVADRSCERFSAMFFQNLTNDIVEGALWSLCKTGYKPSTRFTPGKIAKFNTTAR